MVGAAMKNPIYKRVFRELWAEKAKYLVLFLFLVFSIGFTSGYLVADGSMIRTYNKIPARETDREHKKKKQH